MTWFMDSTLFIYLVQFNSWDASTQRPARLTASKPIQAILESLVYEQLLA